MSAKEGITFSSDFVPMYWCLLPSPHHSLILSKKQWSETAAHIEWRKDTLLFGEVVSVLDSSSSAHSLSLLLFFYKDHMSPHHTACCSLSAVSLPGSVEDGSAPL